MESNYAIVFGETSFDVMKGTKIHSIGYGTRASARKAIRMAEARDANMDRARWAVRNFRDMLLEGYGLDQSDIDQLFREV